MPCWPSSQLMRKNNHVSVERDELPEKQPQTGSQTLDRGLRALEVLAEFGRPMSIAQLADGLGVHRSNAYRILRTLEDHRFALRDEAGLIRLGPRLAWLGRGAAPALTRVAQAELGELSNLLGMTAFITVLDAGEVITMLSVEPSHGRATVDPGSRHPLDRGAPSYAIESSLSPEEHRALYGNTSVSESAALAAQQGYSLSQDEVIRGLTAVAVPLRISGEPPAALAVVTIGVPDDLQRVVSELQAAVARMSHNAL